MTLNKSLWIGLLALGAILGLETLTNIDVWLQNHFYIAEKKEWLINPERHKALTIFFYDGLKRFLLIFACFCLFNMLLSIKYQNLRRANHFCLVMIFSFILVPVVVAGAKAFTNVYCPYQLNIYNGIYPFIRVLEHYPEGFVQLKTGRCFPAGHSTAGFAFMGLFFAFHKKSWRIWGLVIGLTLGWIAGIYQMMRGQHFFSHTLFSMVASFMLILIIGWLVEKIEHRFPHILKSA